MRLVVALALSLAGAWVVLALGVLWRVKGRPEPASDGGWRDLEAVDAV